MMNYLWPTLPITAYRFTLDGNYISNLSSHGVEIRYPQSVRVDHNNFILVTELGDQQVVIAT